MKKFLSLLLALTLVLALCPMSVAAADDVIRNVTVTKTDIKADGVGNTGGYGSLSLGGELIYGIPHQVALIDKTGKFLFDYRETISSFYYDPDSGIISLSGDNGGGIGSLFYSDEVKAKSYPIYYNQDGSVAFSLPFSGNTTYETGPMINGRAVVIETTKSGSKTAYSLYVVDKTGKKVITFSDLTTEPDPNDPDDYAIWKKDIDNFSDGLALYFESSPNEYGQWGTSRIGYMDTTGKVVLDVTGRNYESVSYFSDGLALARNNLKSYYFDKTGKEVIALEGYAYVGLFSYGLATVGYYTDLANGVRTNKVGFIDKTGKFVVPEEYDDGYPGDGLLTVVKDRKYGLINLNNEVVVPFEYEYITTYENGVAYAIKDGYVYIITADEAAPPTPTPEQSESAMPTNDQLTVNGALQSPTVYKINGSNFFKIRDLAAMLNGTEKQFDVGYDNALKSVTVTTGKGYAKLSTDLAGAATGGNQTADPSNDTIYIDGQKIDVTVYKIGGSNYFKLRDLGKALGFYVGWTAEDGVFIDTGKPYSD